MPARPLDDSVLIEALNLVEKYGSISWAKNALGDDIPPRPTMESRVKTAKAKGLKPTFRKESPRIYEKRRLGRMHLVIPDCQIRPGVRLDYLDWVGQYIVQKRPDVVVCIGDFADMESLSRYDMGTIRGENRRLRKDLEVARIAMNTLMAPILACPDYKPELHFTQGNHEERLDRFANEHPYLEEVVGTHMLRWEEWGWKVHTFLKPVDVDGIRYCHYFVSGAKGLAVSSAPALLRLQKQTCVMGHNQKTDIAFHPVTHQWAIFSGLCNLHDEHYLGAQGNDVRRQILVLHEVEDGRCDPMFVSLRYLEKAFA